MVAASHSKVATTLGSGLPSQPTSSVPVVTRGKRRGVTGPTKVAEPPLAATSTSADSETDARGASDATSTSGGLASLDATLAFLKEMKRTTYSKQPRAADRGRSPVVIQLNRQPASPTSSEAARKANTQGVTAFQSSVALQLTSLTASMEQVVSSLSRFKPGDVIVKQICTKFQVAGLTSQSTSTVRFYTDRTEYKFKHERVGDVRMIMYFRDTADVRVDRPKRTLSFHVYNHLDSFAQHYDHQDPTQRISIKFSTLKELMDVEMVAVPLMISSS